MAIRAISLDSTKEYVCKNDKENPTVWVLRCLDVVTFAKIADKLVKPDVGIGAFEGNLLIVRYGLINVKNFVDEKGKPVNIEYDLENTFEGERKVVSWSFLKKIPPYVINELAEQIIAMSRLSEEQEKN